MQEKSRGIVVVLGTGGTVAGRLDPSLPVEGAYRAGQLPLQVLIESLRLSGLVVPWPEVEVDPVDQIDSKDMSVDLWLRLLARLEHHLARPEVCGVVITHGTDTMEETSLLLDTVLNSARPIVLVGAMKPADAPDADGPPNLRDALRLVRDPQARGVLLTMAGEVHTARALRKNHPARLDAFSSGDAGPVARVDASGVHWLQALPARQGCGSDYPRARLVPSWPRVEIITSHAEADGRVVDLLVADGVRGLVVAGTGNGTVHRAIEAALGRARAQGVKVRRCTRITAAGLAEAECVADPEARSLTAAQCRVELQLDLLAADA